MKRNILMDIFLIRLFSMIPCKISLVEDYASPIRSTIATLSNLFFNRRETYKTSDVLGRSLSMNVRTIDEKAATLLNLV